MAVIGFVGCRGRADRCAAVAARKDPAATIARCTVEYERTHEISAGVNAALAHVTRGEDDAVIAWADRLGDAPAAAIVWRRAADVHGKRGHRASALQARARAAAAWQASGKLGEAAYEEYQSAMIQWAASELLPALVAVRRGHALAMRSDDRQMQIATFGHIFTVLYDLGDYAGATSAIEEVRARVAPGNVELRRRLLWCEGLLRFRQGRAGLARAAYHEALTLDEPKLDAATLRSIHYNLVEVELALGNLPAARRDLAAAIAQIPRDGPSYTRSAAAYFGALVALAEAAPERAEAAARGALADTPIADWAWQLEHVLGRALEAKGDLAGAEAAYRRAIGVVEQLRREVSLDALQLAVRDQKRAPYEAAFELAARAGRITDALAIAEQMWQRRFTDAFAGAEVVTASTATVTTGADPLAAKIAGLTAIRAAMTSSPWLEAAPPPAAEGRDVIAWIEARGSLWRYVHIGRVHRLERAPLATSAIATLVAALRADPGDRAAASRLGAALIPAAALAGGRERPLHVIADGVLGGMPVAALLVGGRRLIEERVLAIAPSLGALASRAPATAGRAVVLGAPGTGPRALAGVRAEAIEVGAAVGVAPVLDARATTAALRQAAAAPLLHVAAHGGIDARGAFLELADGRVDAADVLAWRLAPAVVVLASCASGARPGRTLWGAMGAAFLAAGSRAVVATLWSVGDQPARRLIAAFYAAGGARRPHAALAAAQRQAIAAGRPAAEWAPFVVLGAP